MTTLPPSLQRVIGAGNEARTRDLNLGKVALYQLSYSRTFEEPEIVGAPAPKSRTQKEYPTETTKALGLNLMDVRRMTPAVLPT